MYPVRCTGCRCRIAWSPHAGPYFRQAVFCTQLCALDDAAYENMGREDIWALLVARHSWPVGLIAKRWDVAWSIVSRALSRRMADQPRSEGEPAEV